MQTRMMRLRKIHVVTSWSAVPIIEGYRGEGERKGYGEEGTGGEREKKGKGRWGVTLRTDRNLPNT